MEEYTKQYPTEHNEALSYLEKEEEQRRRRKRYEEEVLKKCAEDNYEFEKKTFPMLVVSVPRRTCPKEGGKKEGEKKRKPNNGRKRRVAIRADSRK